MQDSNQDETNNKQQELKALTVIELKNKLEELVAHDRGSMLVSIPYKKTTSSIGATPKAQVTGISIGFDWDRNSIFINTDKQLSEPLKEQINLMDNISRKFWEIQKILRNKNFSDEEKIKTIKENLNPSFEKSKPKTANTI